MTMLMVINVIWDIIQLLNPLSYKAQIVIISYKSTLVSEILVIASWIADSMPRCSFKSIQHKEFLWHENENTILTIRISN